ncbi:MAG: SCO family protein [Acidobacteria bacterium]|nr:SCO family protein [Acidobacteriota bacterium]
MNESTHTVATHRPGFAFLLLIPLLVGATFLSCAQSKAHGQRYQLKGKVVSVDRAHAQVLIDHEEVVGLMPAMAMPFTLKDDALRTVASGDQIQATLVVADAGVWLEDPIITKNAPAGDNTTISVNPVEPREGATVPDFPLVNQDNKPIRLSQYRGRALLITFIYTRCPLPDYCTLMSTNFAEINRELQKDPTLVPKAHLLSVTLDPAYDTAKVLRSYGAAHTEKYGEEKFDTWEFATGDAEEIKRLAQFFGLAYFTEKGQIVHSLRTAIIAPDGKLFKLYHGNEWKPIELLRDLKELMSKDADVHTQHS